MDLQHGEDRNIKNTPTRYRLGVPAIGTSSSTTQTHDDKSSVARLGRQADM